MTSATTWVLYTGIAFLSLYLMRFTGDFLDAILVRVAAILFMAAGIIGAHGWFGDALNSVFNTVNTTGGEIARSTTGSAIMYFVWFALGVLWIMCILPERWFSKAVPDWLSVSGLILPAGIATVPGPAGVALGGIILSLANLVTAPVRALFGA